MPTVARVRSLWTGFIGAPGYTNMHFIGATTGSLPDADAVAGIVHDYWDGMKQLFPTDVTITVQPEQAIIDVSTGQMTGQRVATVLAGVQGLQSGTYSAPTGATQPWPADSFSNGRRVVGRTYLVPLSGAAYQSDGSLASSTVSTMQTAANGLIAQADIHMVILSRPSALGNDGTMSLAGAGAPRDVAAVLRSRRD